MKLAERKDLLDKVTKIGSQNLQQEAKDYIEYGIRKLGLDEEIIVGLTDEEIIKLADSMESKADAAYDAWKERDI